MDFWVNRNATVGNLTLDQVNGAIKKHMTPSTMVKVTAGDKKKMGAPAPTTK
jgi:hypothetical protein